jgi:hypothetical protein
MYIDDVLLITSSVSRLLAEKMVEIDSAELAELNLKLNVDKSCCISIVVRHVECYPEIDVGEQQQQQQDSLLVQWSALVFRRVRTGSKSIFVLNANA